MVVGWTHACLDGLFPISYRQSLWLNAIASISMILVKLLYTNLTRPLERKRSMKLKLHILALSGSIFLAGCAASVAGKYGITHEVDRFSDGYETVTMTGGVVDADYLGIVSNPAEFNPFVKRSHNGKVLLTGFNFSFQEQGAGRWIGIDKNSTAIFLLDEGRDKVTLKAHDGNIDYSVTAPNRTVYTTKYDSGFFSATADEVERIGLASTVEIRVSGRSRSIDFPRRPNNSITKTFLPNINLFYNAEIRPYLNN